MVMQSMRQGKASGVLKFIFFSLLVLAAGGLVLTDVGGFFRGGVQGSEVARIGSETITIQQFDRDLRRVIAQLNISPEQAHQMGYTKQMLNGEIRNRLIKIAAHNIGLRVGEEKVAEHVNDIISPLAQEGQTKKDVLQQILLNQGMSEREFVERISAEVSGNLLTTAIQNGYLGDSDALAETLYQFENEERTIEYIYFPHDDYKLDKGPNEEQLQALYASIKDNYAIPEKRTIRVGIIQDDDLKSKIEISEEEIKDNYESDIESYKIPEQRLVEQAVVQEEQQAKDIFEKARSGQSLKDVAKEITQNETSFIAAQNFEEDGLLDEIKAPVFSSEKTPALLGPFQTALGWHVINVIEISPARQQSFDDVKDQIKKELLENALLDQKFELSGQVDDLAAGGAQLEEISNEIPLKIMEFKDITTMGAMETPSHPLDEFGDDQKEVTEKSFSLLEGELSEVLELADGRQIIIHLQNVTEQSYKPFESVRKELEEQWTSTQKRFYNTSMVTALQERIAMDELSFKDGVKEKKRRLRTAKDLKRKSDVQAPLLPNTLPQIFRANDGDSIIISLKDGIGIAHVKSIKLPATNDKNKDEIEAIKTSLISKAHQEAMTLYLENIRKNTEPVINERLLNQVYGSPSN